MNFLMYDEGDFKALLLGLGLSEDIVKEIVILGSPTDADTVSLVELGTDLASGSDDLKINRNTTSDIHNMILISGGTTKTIPIKAKVPPRNDGFRALLKKLGYSAKK